MYLYLLGTISLLSLPRTEAQKRIIGGVKAKPGEYPYIVALAYKGGIQFCGGCLIDNLHIVTAAHCFQQDMGINIRPRGVHAIAGDINKYFETTSNRRYFDIMAAIIHPNFDIEEIRNDICILKLATPAELNPYITTIGIASRPPEEETDCITLGWGKTGNYEGTSSVLLATEIKVVSFSKCEALPELAPVFREAELCAGTESGKNDSCAGDSGGPLVCHGLLTGIVSFGGECGKAGMYAIYTNISHYKAWIEHVKEWDGIEGQAPGSVFRFLPPHRKTNSKNSGQPIGESYFVTFLIGIFCNVIFIFCEFELLG